MLRIEVTAGACSGLLPVVAADGKAVSWEHPDPPLPYLMFYVFYIICASEKRNFPVQFGFLYGEGDFCAFLPDR